MNHQVSALSKLARNRLPKCGKTVLITIDGPAGSGKTTLATALASNLADSQIIHMDDLYRGWQNTLTDSLTKNLLEIVDKVRNQAKVSYEKFDWLANSINSVGGIVEYPAPRFLIFEGVGSGQSAIRGDISLSIWIEVPVDVGLERVIARDGEIVRDHMQAFLMEQQSHFKKEATQTYAEYLVSGLGIV